MSTSQASASGSSSKLSSSTHPSSTMNPTHSSLSSISSTSSKSSDSTMKAKVEPVHDSNIYKEANNNVDVKPSINNISTSDTSSTTAVTGTSSYVNAQMSMIDSRRAVADELDDPFLIAQP